MEYKENALGYEDYRKLRESVEWLPYSKEQTQKALDNSLYTIFNQAFGNLPKSLLYFSQDRIKKPSYF